MRIKHYLLIILTMAVIAFFQPLVVFLGNLVVIIGAGAYIYTDLPPALQDHYERRIARGLAQLRQLLRRNPSATVLSEPEPLHVRRWRTSRSRHTDRH